MIIRVLIESVRVRFWLIEGFIYLFCVWILEQQEDEEMLVPHSDIVEGPQPMEGLIYFFFFLEVYSNSHYWFDNLRLIQNEWFVLEIMV